MIFIEVLDILQEMARRLGSRASMKRQLQHERERGEMLINCRTFKRALSTPEEYLGFYDKGGYGGHKLKSVTQAGGGGACQIALIICVQ